MANDIDDFLDRALKVKELFGTSTNEPLAEMSEPEKEKILQGSIDELRRFYDHVSNIYDQLRVKALALIAGEVAIVTFIFSGYEKSQSYFPKDGDRQIFFVGGAFALIVAFGFLLWIISSVPWKLAHDNIKAKKLIADYPSNVKFLTYLHDYYVTVNEYCMKLVSNKCRKFNWIVYLLSAGIITLMIVTKLGGRLQ